jgi:hypothetical protein
MAAMLRTSIPLLNVRPIRNWGHSRKRRKGGNAPELAVPRLMDKVTHGDSSSEWRRYASSSPIVAEALAETHDGA